VLPLVSSQTLVFDLNIKYVTLLILRVAMGSCLCHCVYVCTFTVNYIKAILISTGKPSPSTLKSNYKTTMSDRHVTSSCKWLGNRGTSRTSGVSTPSRVSPGSPLTQRTAVCCCSVGKVVGVALSQDIHAGQELEAVRVRGVLRLDEHAPPARQRQLLLQETTS